MAAVARRKTTGESWYGDARCWPLARDGNPRKGGFRFQIGRSDGSPCGGGILSARFGCRPPLRCHSIEIL